METNNNPIKISSMNSINFKNLTTPSNIRISTIKVKAPINDTGIAKINCLDKSIMLFHCNKEKRVNEKLIKERISEKMSIKYLFKKYREIELIKDCFFKGKEFIMVNNIPKPLILIEPKHHTTTINNQENIMEIYNNILNYPIENSIADKSSDVITHFSLLKRNNR